jgi:hypothetical protein
MQERWQPQRQPARFPEREKMTMTARGPVPKRSDQRRRTNSPAAEKVPSRPLARGTYKIPLPASGNWHETAKKWYQSLGHSGQSKWYEPSDWMDAYVAASVLSEMLEAERLSAMLYAAWSSHASRLLVTEGDRRRVRIELEKPQAPDPGQKTAVANLAAWRDKLGSGS